MGLLRGVSHGYHAANAYNALTFPVEALEGDLLVAVISDRYLPSLGIGWTNRFLGSGTEQSARIATKVASAADIAGGGENYVLANAGTGEWAVLAFVTGSFDPVHPIPDLVTDLAATGVDELDYLPVKTGRGLYSYQSVRMSVVGNIFADRGTQLFDRDDVTDTSALYVEFAPGETTLNQKWTTSATVTGAFRADFTVSDAVGTAYFPPITTRTFFLVAAFAAVPYSPDPNQMQLTLTPTLVVLADGNPSPFQVQFQTSSSTDFATTTWTQTMTGRTTGFTTVTVGVNLPDGVDSWWRARAGDGTSWGPWSAPSRLRIYTASASAREYIHLNYGALEGTVRSEVAETVHFNVGIRATSEPHAFEYIYENTGFVVTRRDAAVEYIYEGDVSTNVPVPHVWFTWREYGFVEDHIFVYGQGFGTLQAEFDASILFDWGPDFTLADVSAAVFDWSVQPATPDAYGSIRHINRGTAITMPFTNVETDIVEIIVPISIAPPFAAGAQNDLVYVSHVGGASNKVIFLLYPTVPVPMGLPLTNIRSANKMRMSPMPPDEAALVELHRTPVLEPYLVVGNGPRRLPALLAASTATAEVGTWSVTENLQPALDVDLTETADGSNGSRWLPDPATLSARPDLGTGVLAWEPSQGTTDLLWTMFSDDAGYIDPLYNLPSRNGNLEVPAFVLPGMKWMGTSRAAADTGLTQWTIAMAAVLHAPNNPRGQIVTSYVPGGQPVNTYPVDLTIASDVLTVEIGGRLASVRTTHLSGRAVIIVLGVATEYRVGRLLVIDETGAAIDFGTSAMAPADVQRLYLGRPETIIMQDQTARLDILDLALYPHMLGTNTMWDVANKLDSIYGVSR